MTAADTHPVVTRAEWLEARKRLLAEEKALTERHDALSRARRDLPWVKVEKDYVFDGPDGRETLAQLFAGKSQLVVYHLMYNPGWETPCKSCSFWADNFDRIVPHLAARDVTILAISRAPFEKLEAFRRRIGWSFKWVSSGATDFNGDYYASFTQEQQDGAEASYNYRPIKSPHSDLPGISVFYKDAAGTVFHTYSCYARGIEMMNAAYQYLDLVPKGRDEEGLGHTMAWVRYHDSYGS